MTKEDFDDYLEDPTNFITKGLKLFFLSIVMIAIFVIALLMMFDKEAVPFIFGGFLIIFAGGAIYGNSYKDEIKK